jgi:endonuclease YncB( thermonuclease family)
VIVAYEHRGGGTLCALAVLVSLSLAGHGFAQSSGSDQPIWTDQPVRVDRDKQDFERVGPPPAAANAQAEADRFTVRLGASSHPTVLDSVSFSAGGTRYRLSGLEPVPSAKVCRNKDGLRWACGLRARASLSSLLNGQPVRCAPDGKVEDFELVECRRLGRDLGEVQARAGHAMATAGSRYMEKQAAAKAASEGIWGDMDVHVGSEDAPTVR